MLMNMDQRMLKIVRKIYVKWFKLAYFGTIFDCKKNCHYL